MNSIDVNYNNNRIENNTTNKVIMFYKKLIYKLFILISIITNVKSNY